MAPIDKSDSSSSADARLIELAEQFLREMEDGKKPQIDLYLQRNPDVKDLRNCLEGILAVHGIALDLEAEGKVGSKCKAIEASCDGAVVGDYRIIRELGRGGMGIVYEAQQISLPRKVALKVLPFAGILDERRLRRFRAEANAVAALEHPNIVTVLEAGCDAGVHYIALQLIGGTTLDDLIHRLRARQGDKYADGPFVAIRNDYLGRDADFAAASEQASASAQILKNFAPNYSSDDQEYIDRVTRLGAQLADALEHSHEMGVVHRDIKPSNLLLDASLTPWITDFGLAIVDSDTRMTFTGDLVGTLRYMSPEQALAGKVPVDHRSDIYSLCATLFELVTLEPVFATEVRTSLITQIISSPPPRPRSLNRQISIDLETVLLKGLEKKPDRRYQTAAELKEDLLCLSLKQPIKARPPSPMRRSYQWFRRNRLRVATLAGLLAIVILGIQYSKWVEGNAYQDHMSLVHQLRKQTTKHLREGFEQRQSQMYRQLAANDAIQKIRSRCGLMGRGVPRLMASPLPTNYFELVYPGVEAPLLSPERLRVFQEGIRDLENLRPLVPNEEYLLGTIGELQSYLAKLHLQKNELGEAKELCDRAIESFRMSISKNGTVDTSALADALHNRACLARISLSEPQNLDEMRRLSDDFLARPYDAFFAGAFARAHQKAALASIDSGDFESAVQSLRAATTLDPDSFEMQFELGMLYRFLGSPKCIPCFERAYRIVREWPFPRRPKNSFVEIQHGFALAMAYKTITSDEAKCEEVLMGLLNLEVKKVHRLLVEVELSRIRLEHAKTTTLVDEYLAVGGTSASIVLYAAEAFGELSQFNASEKMFSEARRKAATDWDHIRLAQRCVAKLDAEAALQHLAKAASANPSNYYIYFCRGEIYTKLDRHSDASIEYETAVQLSGGAVHDRMRAAYDHANQLLSERQK